MITREQLLKEFGLLRAEFPNRINPGHKLQDANLKGCRYSYGGQHCVAGELIIRLGGTLPSPYSRLNQCSFSALFKSFDIGIQLDSQAIKLLDNLQFQADRGIEWSQLNYEGS